MNSRFKNVPLDPDTKIDAQRDIRIQDLDALHQHWNWDGIRAESLVFVTTDIAQLSPDDLKDLLVKEHLINPGERVTTSQSESGYTFINFHFRS